MLRLSLLVVLFAFAVTGGLRPNAAWSASPTAAPAQTGETRDARAARERHEKILQAIGRYDDERLQQYVNEIGQRMAAKSDRPDLKYTFTVLDSNQVNAFADPGGYIYVYRGLLAYLSSEAELAATLGHEIAHVTARHSAGRQTGAVAANVGATLVGILTGNPALMDVAGLAGGALVMGYSREQESEADELGAQSLSRAGYDPTAMAGSLRKLWNLEQFELQEARDAKRSPGSRGGLMASHPELDKRIRESEAFVSKGLPAAGEPRPANRDVYLANIDGMAFGSSEAQGVVRGSRFYHGGMGVTMAFPSGWTIDNQPAKVQARPAAGDQIIEVSAQAIPPNTSPQQLLGRLMQGRSSTAAEPFEVNGLTGYRANFRSMGLPWGNQGPAAVAVVYYNGLAYIFLGATRVPTAFSTFERIFVSSVSTFRRLRDNEYAAAGPVRIRVVQAGPDTRIAELARKSANNRYPEEEVRLLNDLYPDREPTPGQKLKIVE